MRRGAPAAASRNRGAPSIGGPGSRRVGAEHVRTAPRRATSRLRRRASPLPHDIDNRVIKVNVCDSQRRELLRRIRVSANNRMMAVSRPSKDPLLAQALRSLVRVLLTEPRRLGFRNVGRLIFAMGEPSISSSSSAKR
jgi:hypothetical protein